MTRLVSLIAIASVLGPAAAATAQTTQPGTTTSSVFVTGDYFSGVQRSANISTNEPGIQVDLSGQMTGRGFGVGTFLTPHLLVEFEMSFPQALTTVAQSPAIINGIPAAYVEQVNVAQTTDSGTVLVGYRSSNAHRVRGAYLGGLALIADRQVTNMNIFGAIDGFMPTASTSNSVTYRTAPEAGLDVDVALSPHLTVSPEIRLLGFNGTVLLRSAVGFRVIF